MHWYRKFGVMAAGAGLLALSSQVMAQASSGYSLNAENGTSTELVAQTSPISVDKSFIAATLNIGGTEILGEPDIVVLGESGSFEIVVTNNDSDTVTGIQVTDDFSPESMAGGTRLVIDNVTVSDGRSQVMANNTISWTIDSLEPGETATLAAEFSVRVPQVNEFTLEGTLGSTETGPGGEPTSDLERYHGSDFGGFFRYTDAVLRPENDGRFDGYNLVAPVGTDSDGDGFGDIASAIAVSTDQGHTDTDSEQLLVAAGAMVFQSSSGTPGLGYFSGIYELAEGSHDGRGGGYCRCSPREEFSLNIKWQDERPHGTPREFLDIFRDGFLTFSTGSFALTPEPSEPSSTRVLEIERAIPPSMYSITFE